MRRRKYGFCAFALSVPLALTGCLQNDLANQEPLPADPVEVDAGVEPPPVVVPPMATIDASVVDAAPITPPPAASAARALFDAKVLPVLSASCAACHSSQFAEEGPDYLGGAPSAFYAALTMNARLIGDSPANSLLVNKGAHAGPALSAAQKLDFEAFIVQWNLERGVRPPLDGGAPAISLTQALEKFGRCMNKTDWDANNLNDLGNQATTQGPCASCHSVGTGGNWLSLTVNGQNLTFAKQKVSPYVLKWVLGTVDVQGAFSGLVPANRFRDKGQEPGIHPKFVLSTARQQGVDNFFNATLARYNAGDCL